MLDMRMETSINSISYYGSMYKMDAIEAAIDDFVKYYHSGYDITSGACKRYILESHGLKEERLSQGECDYIARCVERRIN